jgi:hypothetical protein
MPEVQLVEYETIKRVQRPEFPKDTEVVVKATGRKMKVFKDNGDLNIMCYSHDMQYDHYHQRMQTFEELHVLDELLVKTN